MGFLHHLAGMALGAKPASAARPTLPSRFAASPFAGTSQGLEVIDQATPTIPALPARPEVAGSPLPLAMPPAPSERKEAASPAAARSQRPPPPAEPQAAPSQSLRPDAGSPPPSPLPSIVNVVERRSPSEKSSAVIGKPAERSQPVPAAQQPPAPLHLEIQTLPEAPVTRAAPLSPAVVAGRAMAVREQAPVIHVTIDRLDVRAPARARARAGRGARPQPAVSLSDYLRDGAWEGGDELAARHRRGQRRAAQPARQRADRSRRRDGHQRRGERRRARHDRSRERRRSAAAQSLPLPGDAQSRLAQRRSAVAQRRQRRAADQRAAGARPALHADGLRPAPTSRPRSCSATPCICCTSGRCSTAPPSAARSIPARSTSACCRRPSRRWPASDLADQVELIKITPAAMSIDDMSKLWTAIQSNYRPSSAYQVSVVLIEGTRPGGLAAAGAVARQASIRSPIAIAASWSIPTCCRRCRPCSRPRPPSRRPARGSSDQVTLSGVRLAGTGHAVRLTHRLFADAVRARARRPSTPTGTSADHSPAQRCSPRRARSRPGQLSASVRFTPTGETDRARDQCHPAGPWRRRR